MIQIDLVLCSLAAVSCLVRGTEDLRGRDSGWLGSTATARGVLICFNTLARLEKQAAREGPVLIGV